MIWIYQAVFDEGAGQNKRETERKAGKDLLVRGLWERYGIDLLKEGDGAIGKGGHGKPYLKNHPQIHYNISHTGGLAVCALGDAELGIDAEKIRPVKDNILRKVLSPEELTQMEELAHMELPPGQVHSELFFRFWTLKESYVKAVGCGITIPLADVSFLLPDEGNPVCSISGYQFWQTVLGGYVLSVCVRSALDESPENIVLADGTI